LPSPLRSRVKGLGNTSYDQWLTATQTSNPRIIAWNAGPHCYRNSRDKIWSLFAQGQTLICLQDLRIPRKLILTIKDKLHAKFQHYWIIISTVNKQGVSCDSSGEHYNFTTLTALESHHFPSATSEILHSRRQLRRGKGLHPIVSGRALALSTTTKSGGRFVIINLYQFTAANTAEQTEVWDIIAAWVLKHPNDKIILIGDFNSVPAGERTGCSLRLCKAEDRLQDFCQDTGGDLVSSKCHSWHRGKQSASLDNAVTWNYHLSQPQVCSFEAKHKLYDHEVQVKLCSSGRGLRHHF